MFELLISCLVAIGLTVVTQTFMMMVLFCIHRLWSEAYTNDQEIVDLSSRIIQIAAFIVVVDGIQGACSGVLRGCAKQKIGATLNLVAYYVISLPIGIPLAFLTSLQVSVRPHTSSCII